MADQPYTSRAAEISFLFLMVLGAAVALIAEPPFVAELRRSSFDTYNRLLPRPSDGGAVIVGIDEDSARQPLVRDRGRKAMGDLVAILGEMGAKAVAFDQIFHDVAVRNAQHAPGDHSPETTAALAQYPKDVAYNDAYFSYKMSQAGRAVLGYLANSTKQGYRMLPKARYTFRGADEKNLSRAFFTSLNYQPPLKVLSDSAAGEGFVDYLQEDDGLLRQIPLIMSQTDEAGKVLNLLPALALETVRVSLGRDVPYEIRGTARGGIRDIAVGPYIVPTDPQGVVRVYYSARTGRDYIPVRAVLEGRMDPSWVKDKIVLVGITSSSLGDIKPSPLNPYMQGVQAHAEMVEQILQGQFLHRAPWMGWLEAALTLAATMGVILLAQNMNALLLAGIASLGAGALAGGGLLVYHHFGWLIDPLCPSVIMGVFFILAAILAALRTRIISHEKSRFLALMSHEIRTPMTGILGMIEFMKADDLTAEERAEYVGTISECSKTLLNTLNDILDISKLEEGKLEISPVNCDLHAVLENSVSILTRMARNKGITLSAVIGDGVPRRIHADPHRLQQIVMNLMNNAIKFTAKGGVTLHCAYQAGPPPVIRVEVRDTGIGISEKNMKKLFKGFSQADNSIARKYGGTGLGLSIARDLLLLMGGTVGVNSVLGEGSTFWFELPFHPPVADEGAKEETVDALPMNILLAEDNKVNQQVALRLLNSKGHTVAIADDGETVVRMAQEKDFDMILMDMNMPVKSGIDAAREIRALGGKFKDMPIIALTANVVDEYVKKCYAAGMNAHVAKPFAPKELYKTLARFAPATGPVVAEKTEDPAEATLNDNLKEIRRQLGAAYLQEMIGNSLKESTRLLNVGRAAFDAGDHEALSHAAHDLKNVSGLIGLKETSRLSALVEALCRKGELLALPELMTSLCLCAPREIGKMERDRAA